MTDKERRAFEAYRQSRLDYQRLCRRYKRIALALLVISVATIIFLK